MRDETKDTKLAAASNIYKTALLSCYLPHNFMKMNECLQGPMKFYGGRKIFIEMVRVL